MNLIQRAASALTRVLSSSDGSYGGWHPYVHEPYTGAWQRHDEWSTSSVLAHPIVYACVNRIASDMGKLRPKLVELNKDTGIWSETESAAFSPVLRKPNRYQNHIQFKEWWAQSKLRSGNTYALKERDARGVVRALYLLDPSRVTVLVAPDGDVYYELKADNLGGVQDQIIVPADEIIHDRMNCIFHPLVGTSPIFAAGAAANIGLHIQHNSSKFFFNGSKVSGQLLLPVAIDQKKADEMRERWEAKFAGDQSGKIAVLSGGARFEPLQMTSVDAQLIEQLRWTAEAICSAFHIPAYKVGVKDATYNGAETANQVYYSDCLQAHIEQFELCMDEGLGLTENDTQYGVELDLDGLLRMDTSTTVSTLVSAVGGSLMTVNEGRKKMDLAPVDGGDTIWMQQQNYSLEALDERDKSGDPFGLNKPAPQLALPPAEAEEEAEPKLKIERDWTDLFLRDAQLQRDALMETAA